MPRILYGSSAQTDSIVDLSSVNHDYDYPDGLELKPGSKLHDKLRDEVIQRANEANAAVSNRYESWNKIDEVLTTYIPLDQDEQDVKAGDGRKPVSIIFPYTYAIHETVLTYLVNAFLTEPIFRYEGVSPEDTIGAVMLEKVVEVHCNKNKIALALHTMFRDALAYGVGVSAPGWNERWGFKTRVQQNGFQNMFGRFIGQGSEKVSEEALLFEGNKLDNIDPYLYLPDPNVSVDSIQDGEYCGFVKRTNLMNLLYDESVADGDLFNVKYLRQVKNKQSSIFAQDNSKRYERTGMSNSGIRTGSDNNTTNPVDVVSMYVKIIPRDWDLGESEYPEKWLFALANDSVIIRAQPLGLDHDMFPMVTCAPDFDGYSALPLSRVEVLSGLQETLDWLFNCYDAETEVLTNDGWKLIADASDKDLDVATVNPDTMEMTFETPKRWFEYDYEGYMVSSLTNRHSAVVTPNHNMFGRYRHSDARQFKEAGLLFDRRKGDEFYIPMSVNWKGEVPENIVFNEILPKRNRGSKLRYPEVDVNYLVMAAYLGWVLSDGSICKGTKSGTYSVIIKQAKEKNFDDIESIIKSLGFHVTVNANEKGIDWIIADKRLYGWLKDECYNGGTTGEFKKVPDFIKSADPFTIELFLDCFIKGDGHIVPTHKNLVCVGTESPYLADDLQELCLKVGWSCSVRLGRTKIGKDFWSLNINKHAPWSIVNIRNTCKTPYKGKVYCFENSTHLTVVRRDGKAFVCGQSHIANVRKAINDMLVVDPYLVNINDLKDPKPGKLVRMRRPAWGRGVGDAVQQLQVNDITRANIGDSSFIVNWMQKIGAADDPMMGALRSGGPERLTKGEFQGTQAGAASRLGRIAKVIGLQAMQDLGYMFASHVQQLMSQELYATTTGRWQETISAQYGPNAKRMKVTPHDVLIDYDVIVRDGSVPGGNFSDTWVQMFQVLAANPELQQTFDIGRIFKYIATNMGAKNVDEFVRMKPQVMPDEQVQQQVQAGNMVPMQEAMGGL